MGGVDDRQPRPAPPVLRWLAEARSVLERLGATQADAIEQASQWCADAIAGGGLVHLFGTGHSRIPVEEMFPRYGSYPGFNPIVELSMTFHTQVVGANGQRQAMVIERMPGLAEVILSNFTFGPNDVMVVFSAGGLTAVPVEMARGARRRGLRVIAVTSVAQSMSAEPSAPPAAGCSTRPTSSSTCARPHADALIAIDGSTPRSARARRSRRSPSSIASRCGRPSSSWSAGAMPPVITRASVVGAERSRALFDAAYESTRDGSPVPSPGRSDGRRSRRR